MFQLRKQGRIRKDYFRASLARKIGRNVELVSRQGRSLADAFPEAIAALAKLRTDVVLDCELVVVDVRGHPQWERLRRRALIRRPSWALDAARKEPAMLCAFDVLLIGGRDVRAMPLAARKTRLARLLEGVEGLHYVAHLRTHGEALFAKAVELDLEGIVAKRADSPYRAGRQPTWAKIKNQDYWRREPLRFKR